MIASGYGYAALFPAGRRHKFQIVAVEEDGGRYIDNRSHTRARVELFCIAFAVVAVASAGERLS
jgi:hypothetical protein